MGIPYHTSQDIPGRCLWLIDRLFSEVQEIADPFEPELGPLDTTFLFAMSTLIFTLPIERLERHRRREEAGEQGYMDDRPINPASAKDIDLVLGSDTTKFSSSPFYVSGAWRFASINYTHGLNLALEFPEELATELSSDAGIDAADNMSARAWINCVRNALAHGGLIYLDADGRQVHGKPTTMMGFVSAQYPNGNMRLPPERLIALRTTPLEYRATLEKWVCWVQSTGLSVPIAA